MTDDRVDPTARWFARGVWKFVFVLVVTLIAFALIGLVVRAVFGLSDDEVRSLLG